MKANLSASERWSLLGMWWGTAWVSLLGWGGISHELVRQAAWVPLAWVSPLVALGIGVDVGMGAWMWLRPGVWACRAAWVLVLGLTLVASAMVPLAWLHPFGPLLKNGVVLALLWRGCAWGQSPSTCWGT